MVPVSEDPHDPPDDPSEPDLDAMIASLEAKGRAQEAAMAAMADPFWTSLSGVSHATISYDGFEWTAHDAGLVRHHFVWGESEIEPVRFVAELILWSDVRDVETEYDAEVVGGLPLQQWSVLIQYPRISVKGPQNVVRSFGLAVAELMRRRDR
jgi:hypothetical protein